MYTSAFIEIKQPIGIAQQWIHPYGIYPHGTDPHVTNPHGIDPYVTDQWEKYDLGKLDPHSDVI